MVRRLGALLALLASAAATLAVAAPDPRSLRAAAHRPQEWVGLNGADQAVLTIASGLAWLALAWLSIGVILTIAAELPGMAGRVSAAIAGLVLPSVLRQGLVLALGAGIAVGGSSVAWAEPASPPSPATASPTAASASAARAGDVALDWPARPPQAAGATPDPISAQQQTVVVRAGDSLWRIAEDQLGPQTSAADVARAVQAWYVANDEVIGADPDLIQPGQELRPPAAGGSR